MGFLGNLISFAAGAAAGAAGGVAASRLLAPRSGEETQKRFEDFRGEITTAGESAKAETEANLMSQYRQTLSRVGADNS